MSTEDPLLGDLKGFDPFIPFLGHGGREGDHGERGCLLILSPLILIYLPTNKQITEF